jgi:hypothetical protein
LGTSYFPATHSAPFRVGSLFLSMETIGEKNVREGFVGEEM